jgi:hypothetical protein
VHANYQCGDSETVSRAGWVLNDDRGGRRRRWGGNCPEGTASGSKSHALDIAGGGAGLDCNARGSVRFAGLTMAAGGAGWVASGAGPRKVIEVPHLGHFILRPILSSGARKFAAQFGQTIGIGMGRMADEFGAT